MKSPLAKHMNTFNKPSIMLCKRRKKLEATVAQEAEENVSEELVEAVELNIDEEE